MDNSNDRCDLQACVQRRRFLQAAATSVATVTMGQAFPGYVAAADEDQRVLLTQYPTQRIAALSDIELDAPLPFAFPTEALHCTCMLIKLGRRAGGGVGADQDIVAFNASCTHMGGDLIDGYISEHKLLGCGEHLTTFDLTRHGMMVTGHATQSLPQIVLTVEQDMIYANGIVGLLYGYHENPAANKE